MPQLDLFVFVSCYVAFFSFLIGFFVFQSWSLPLLLSISKLGSNRIAYYYSSLLLLNNSVACDIFIDLFNNTAQVFKLSYALMLTPSSSFTFYPAY